MDKIFPREAAQEMRATIGRTFKCHTNIHRKGVLLRADGE